jgi:hypothetical protein
VGLGIQNVSGAVVLVEGNALHLESGQPLARQEFLFVEHAWIAPSLQTMITS